MNKLTSLFLETGLLQFGWFEPGGMPFRLNLDLLPAYPDVLSEIAVAAKPHTNNMNRLVSVPEAMPFGVALSLETNIPLVYSRGGIEAPAHDLVGAYDIGHPALFLINVLNDRHDIQKLILNARNVGLQIHHLLAIVDLGVIQTLPDVKRYYLLDFDAEIAALMHEGRLTIRQGNAVIKWIREQDSR